MDWIIENWGFVSGITIAIAFLAGIAWQTKRNAKDIKQLEDDLRKNKIESDRVIEKLFSKIEDNRRELAEIMANGFKSIDDRLWGLLKDGKFKKD